MHMAPCIFQLCFLPFFYIIIIVMIFYCRLIVIVHITDTRAQKVVSYTSTHIIETVFAHVQHWGD